MNILVTGSNGFIGTNLVNLLKNNSNYNILSLNKNDKLSDIDFNTIDIVFHLACVHRPLDREDFKKYNVFFTYDLLQKCKSSIKPPIVIYTSSVQSSQNTDYGNSKRECENMICEYRQYNNLSKYFQLTNTFGEFAIPNRLSVVATFCYNISHNKPIVINDGDTILKLIYVGDVVKSLHHHSVNNIIETYPLAVTPYYEESLKSLAYTIELIKNGVVMCDDFDLKLKKTYDYYASIV
jgi:UDP-2-acetamido-2,6-beta-L-arabino-hexul-4-ose reductase